MPSYSNGVVTVTTVATKILTVPAASGNILVKNLDATNDIFLGGPGVTADNTATGGWLVPKSSGSFPDFTASTPETLPSPGGADSDLYAISTGGTPKLSYIFA